MTEATPAPGSAAPTPSPASEALRNYVNGRAIAVGYGSFDYAGYMDGGFTYPSGTTSGVTLGGGVSYGWYVSDDVALGLMIDFDGMIAPSAEKHGTSVDGIAAMMPNRTLGGFVAYHLSDSMTLESDLAFGGGGTSKAVGGIGLQIHEQLVIATKTCRTGCGSGR